DEERPGKAFGSGSGSDGFAGGDEHRPAAGRVNVEHPYTEARRRGAGAGDGVRNVVELEVEEEAEAASDELAHDLRARSNDELLADLDRAAARVEPRGERERGLRVGKVQRDDHPRGGGFRRNHRASPCGVANSSPTSGSRGSASSTGAPGSRNARTCRSRAA